MICGIDLGTTYSLIGHGNTLYSDLVASAVDLETRQQIDLDDINPNVIHSYKTDMTTGEMGQLPIQCSSIVLRKLADLASRRSGEQITDVVISVPAKFTTTQREATWKAAEKAGLHPKGLINEPTAAAIYACKDYKDLIVVYDLGGGTFDVTILDSRTGDYYVVATDGNGHLAGDNLDKAIADYVMKECHTPILRKSKINLMHLYKACRHAKENLTTYADEQFIEVPEMDINFKLEKDTYIELMKQTFDSTITLTKQIIGANLMECDHPKILFVGGSTADKYLREWVKGELQLEELKFDCNPSFIVAKGVSLYAEMVENGRASIEVSDVTNRLAIEMSNGTTETIIEKNSIIPITESYMLVNTEDTQYLNVNLYQGDGTMAIENSYIGTLAYDYGQVMASGAGIVEIEVTVDRDGQVTIMGTDIARNQTQEIKLVMR
jgi:molecular chaperone DnaK (HSP70)